MLILTDNKEVRAQVGNGLDRQVSLGIEALFILNHQDTTTPIRVFCTVPCLLELGMKWNHLSGAFPVLSQSSHRSKSRQLTHWHRFPFRKATQEQAKARCGKEPPPAQKVLWSLRAIVHSTTTCWNAEFQYDSIRRWGV